jgi:hypothetical protein
VAVHLKLIHLENLENNIIIRMKQTITEKANELFPNHEDIAVDVLNEEKRYIYQMGAQEVVTRIHNALKGLQLDKHGIALNVLKIAGIEPPKN